jgi:hypothetical protein
MNNLYKNEEDHQRWLRKTNMQAVGFEDRNFKKKLEEKFGKELSERPHSCYTCKKKMRCMEFKTITTGGTAGAVSIDASVKFLCEKYDALPIQKKNLALSSGQVSNLLKRAKTGKL